MSRTMKYKCEPTPFQLPLCPKTQQFFSILGYVPNPPPSLRRLNISCGISKLRESLGCQSLIAASWKSKLQSWILLLFKTGCTIPVKGETHPKSKQNKCTWRVWPWGRCVWGFHKHTFFLLGASQCMKQHIWKVSTTLLKTHPGLRCCNSTPVCHSVH